VQFKIGFLASRYKNIRDEELIPLIREGNVSAFNELFQRYSERLYLYLLKMLHGDEEQANDSLQELFLKIIEKGHYFDSKRNFSTWIYKIATNMCINAYKAQKIRAEKADKISIEALASEHANKDPTIEHEIDRDRFEKMVMRELNGFNSETKSIFLLRFQEDLSIKEISKIVLLPEGTVKSRLFYTIKKLAQRLQHFNQPE